jgi:hypothetical protein
LSTLFPRGHGMDEEIRVSWPLEAVRLRAARRSCGNGQGTTRPGAPVWGPGLFASREVILMSNEMRETLGPGLLLIAFACVWTVMVLQFIR